MTTSPEPWEEEVLARHRWGRHGPRAQEELERLRKLRPAAGELNEEVVNQIRSLEICNWNLGDGVLELCAAIASNTPARRPVGHMGSVSWERWRRIWGYYAGLRNWLLPERGQGYRTLSRIGDPEQTIASRLQGLLGERSELKDLYVERFCHCLDFWLSGSYPVGSAQRIAHDAAVSALEREIRARDPQGKILGAMQEEGDGALQPCHHKAFRRYDIIVSSIGAGQWRAAMPEKGDDGIGRAAMVDQLVTPVEAWIEGRALTADADTVSRDIQARLGERDDTKVFLASLLASILRAQQLAARQRAESRQAV